MTDADLASRLNTIGRDICQLARDLGSRATTVAVNVPISTIDRLRATVAARGMAITGDDYVPEVVAAELIGRSPATMANWRQGKQPLAFIKRGGRIYYALDVLAAWLDNHGNIEP